MALEILDDFQEEPQQPEATQDATETKPVIDIAGGKMILEKQLELLQKQLSRRSEMPFNPILMKMAAGFLAPTKTGSFGESLGYAAQAGSEAAEKEQARKTDVEKLQSDLAIKQFQLKQQAAGMQMLQDRLGKKPMAGAGTESPPPADLMPTEQKVEAIAKNPNILDTITIDDDLIMALSAAGMKDVANLAMKLQESQVKRAKLGQDIFSQGLDVIQVAHPYDRTDTNRYPIPKMMAPIYYKLLAEAQSTGDTTKIDQFMARVGVPGFVGKASANANDAANTASAPPTKSFGELQTDLKIAETTGQKRAELAVKDEAGLRSAKIGARPIINAADDIISIVSSNPKYFDLLNSTDMKDAISRTVSKGIQTPGGAIRIDMKDIAAAVEKLPPEDRTAGMLAAQKMLQIQLSFARSFLKGEGQITEGERAIVAQATVDGLDNSTALRLKAEALKMRAEQDEKMYTAYNAFRKANKGATYDDFLDSPQYNNLVDAYERRLAKVRDANARLLGGGKTAPEKKPSAGGSLYNRLKEEGTE